MLGGFSDFTLAQRHSHDVELLGIVQGKIWRPPSVILYKFDRDLGRIAAFVNKFDGFSDHHFFRRIKSDDHRSLSGRYAVITTPGSERSLGIPQTTWRGLRSASNCNTRTLG